MNRGRSNSITLGKILFWFNLSDCKYEMAWKNEREEFYKKNMKNSNGKEFWALNQSNKEAREWFGRFSLLNAFKISCEF